MALMRYRLRPLLILLAILAGGCDRFPRDSRVETIKHGGEAVEKHAKEIEAAANPQKLPEPNR